MIKTNITVKCPECKKVLGLKGQVEPRLCAKCKTPHVRGERA